MKDQQRKSTFQQFKKAQINSKKATLIKGGTSDFVGTSDVVIT